MSVTAVILAAGKGTRMRSSYPKVLHPILGKPMVSYAVENAAAVTGTDPVLVIGHQAELIKQTLGNMGIAYVLQEDQLGTGHAVQQVEKVLSGRTDLVLVVYGDMPAVRPETLRSLIAVQREHQGPLSLLTVKVEHPRGFGRVVRDQAGNITAIVEEADASEEQLAIDELNAGLYCFRADWLWEALKTLQLSPQGEYYLTDLVAAAVNQGESVQSVRAEEQTELIGINNRIHLAEAGKILQRRINHHWMLAGVSMPDPESVFIGPDVCLSRDTVILPNTHLLGSTTVGESCQIGPNSMIVDSRIADRCEIQASVVENARVEDDVDIGPFSHLRKGAHLAPGVHLGNFGEVKDSYLGEGTKMGHFSYLGNAQIGRNVNIGAGTITCNYDGREKHTTVVKDGAFLGSDTMLVAPVEVGENARTGAGAVVTRHIPDDSLAIGVPARSVSPDAEGQGTEDK